MSHINFAWSWAPTVSRMPRSLTGPQTTVTAGALAMNKGVAKSIMSQAMMSPNKVPLEIKIGREIQR